MFLFSFSLSSTIFTYYANTCPSFFASIHRIAVPTYIPSEEDILHTSANSTTIIETPLSMGTLSCVSLYLFSRVAYIPFAPYPLPFPSPSYRLLTALLRIRIIDVGGMRSERRKWIHCFEKYVFLIFCDDLLWRVGTQNHGASRLGGRRS
jgi:guanine nucleotide-binding protein subunit alpha